MNYESVSQALEELRRLEQTMAAYNHAMGVMYLDSASAAPKNTTEGRGKTMEVLSRVTYDLLANPENETLLSYLEANQAELDPKSRREVEVLRKQYDQNNRIPADEYFAYSVLVNESENAW